MDLESHQSYKKDVLRFALFIGELMLTNGAETSRVEDSILRICKSRNFNHINIFASPTVIIISDEKFDGLSFMKTIKSRSISLNKISLLNTLSREFVSNQDISISDAMKRAEEILNVKSYPKWVIYLGSGMASASFSSTLGGTSFLGFIFTFITSIIAVITYYKILKISSIPVFSSVVSSFLIAIAGVFLTEVGILSDPTMLIVGSIMPLLPGVAFVKGIRDLIFGDLISGVARAFDAAITAISIAGIVGVVLDMWFRLGGGF